MLDKMSVVWELTMAGLESLANTDFSKVEFESLGLALGASLFILGSLLFKLLWGRDRFYHLGSGHKVPLEYHRGKISKIFYMFPKFIFVIGVVFLLLAIANPYLPRTKIDQTIESRERVDLIDMSSSMGWEFENTGKSGGEFAREGFLKFLNMRRGQNDKTSLWFFSTKSYIEEDFIIDDDVYFMEVSDAPYTIVDPGHSSLVVNDPNNYYKVDIVAPPSRVRKIPYEGSTQLNPALDAIIKYFDTEGDKRVKNRALIVVTDAAVEQYPEDQLKELKKRNIGIYFLHIKPNVEGERQYGTSIGLSYAELLKRYVEQHGGQFYDVRDDRSLEAAYRDINKLETAPLRITRHLLKILIYQRPLIASIVLMFLAISFGVLIERYLGKNL